jgi:hypothetical protein
LDTHGKSIFVQVEIDESNLGILDRLWHTLSGSGGFNGVTINKLGLLGGSTVSL